MSELEKRMERIGWRWYRQAIAPISESDALALKAWAVKSYIVWAAYCGGIRTFGASGDPQWSVPPPATAGRLLYEGDWETAASSMTLGWGRIRRATDQIWSFGNPQIGREVPTTGFLRASGALRLNLDLLQLWVVDSLFWQNQVQLPAGIRPIRAGMPFRRLEVVAPHVRVESVVVGA